MENTTNNTEGQENIETAKTIIDMEEHRNPESRIFSGRQFGKSIRARRDLNVLDNQGGCVEVIFPDLTWSINDSFFLEMFEDSIEKLGEKRFKEKYIFVGPFVEEVVEYALAVTLNKTIAIPDVDDGR